MGACKDRDRGNAQRKGAAAVTAPTSTAPAVESRDAVVQGDVVLGQPTALTGKWTNHGVELWRGASAAFSTANDAGGVHGRKIKLVLQDHAFNPDRAPASIVKLVEVDHAFAIFNGLGVPNVTRELPVVRQFFQSHGLVYFSNYAGFDGERKPPHFEHVFNVRASTYQEAQVMVGAFIAMGRKRIGFFGRENAHLLPSLERALSDKGLSFVADQRYKLERKYEDSAAGEVKALREAGVDAVMMLGPHEGLAGFIRDARMQGWDVPIHFGSQTACDPVLSVLVDEEKGKKGLIAYNLFYTATVPDVEDVSLLLVREYRAAIDKYRPLVPPEMAGSTYAPTQPYGLLSLEGFMNAKAFVAVLQHAGEKLTRKTFYEAAERIGKFDLGVGTPAEFSPTRHQALDKVWLFQASPTGWKATLAPTLVKK